MLRAVELAEIREDIDVCPYQTNYLTSDGTGISGI